MGIVAMNPPHPFEPTPHQPPLTFAGDTATAGGRPATP
jgi:hypothetical protein